MRGDARAGLGASLLYLLGGACGVMLVIAGLRRGTTTDVAIGAAIVLVVVLLSPPAVKRFSALRPRPTDPAVIAAAPVVIYWRPLCPYSARLRDRLGKLRRRALWVNIWRDPDAAATVRGLNAGDETVPTVIIDGKASTNPDLADVRAALEALPDPRR